MGGTIISKNHPSDYDNYYDEEWTLEAPEGHIIQLTFESFDIEAEYSCAYDWVEVSYGSYSEKFCGPVDWEGADIGYYNENGDYLGSTIPGPFTSSATGPTMIVRMHTDGDVTRTGFRAVWARLS